MEEVRFYIPNISCQHCVMRIKQRLNEVEGVDNVEASAETREVTVWFDEPASEKQLLEALEEINYPAVN